MALIDLVRGMKGEKFDKYKVQNKSVLNNQVDYNPGYNQIGRYNIHKDHINPDEEGLVYVTGSGSVQEYSPLILGNGIIMRIALTKSMAEAWWVNCIDIGSTSSTSVCLYGVVSRFTPTNYDSNGFPNAGVITTFFEPDYNIDYYPLSTKASFYSKETSAWHRFWHSERNRYNVAFTGDFSDFVAWLKGSQLNYGYKALIKYFKSVPEGAFKGSPSINVSTNGASYIASAASTHIRKRTFHRARNNYTYARYAARIVYDGAQPYIVLYAEQFSGG